MYFDSHCHLQFPEFEEDLPDVIERAFDSGVEGIVVVGTTIDDSLDAIALARQYPEIYAAVGIHPYDTNDVNDELLYELERLMEEQHVVAIGEVGLDYYRGEVTPEQQKKIMAGFVEVARETSMPIIVHQRQANEDIYNIIKENGNGEVTGVMHCFSGDVALAERMIDLGFYISFAGNISFKNFKQQDVVRAVPLERLLIETDAPFLAPEPFRGKRNEPAHIIHTAEGAARILGMTEDEIGRLTTENTRRLFGINEERE